MEAIKNKSNEIYKDLLIDYEKWKWKETSFDESLNMWFFPISFTNLEDWYYTRCLTSDLKYNFRILEDWNISWWWKENYIWGDIENFIEMTQAVIKMWWLQSMSQGSHPNLKIIPIEKIKKLNLEWFNKYLKDLEKDIESNQEEYKKRVQEIWERWSEDL